MELIDNNSNLIEIRISFEELNIFYRSLNEVCRGIDLFEFETRMGDTKEDVLRLMERILEVINETSKNNMGSTEDESRSVEIRLSINELLMIHQSLNEICHGFYLSNFQEKIGVTRKEAVDLMDEISGIYHGIEKPSEEYYY